MIKTLKTYKRAFADMIRASSINFISYCVFDILHALSYVLVLISTKNLFDTAYDVYVGNTSGKIIESLILFLFAMIFNEIVNGIANFPIEHVDSKITNYFASRLQRKASEVESIRYTEKNFLDNIERARRGIDSGIVSALIFKMIFTFYIPYFILVSIFMSSYAGVLILTIAFIFAPILINNLISAKMLAKREDKLNHARRCERAYEKYIIDREYFAQTRSLGAFGFFYDKYENAKNKIVKENNKDAISFVWIDYGLKIINVIGYVSILFMLLILTLNGNISIGVMAAIFTSLGTMYDLANELFGGAIEYSFEGVVYLDNYYKFIDEKFERKDFVTDYGKELDEKDLDKIDKSRDEIVIRNLSFKYINSKKYTLEDINLTIKSKETIAIVGENGAGKSTLANLILGLYKPSKGDIISLGINTKVNFERLRNRESAVFQDFQKYKMSLEENILISEKESYKNIKKYDKKIRDILRLSDIDFSPDMFPKGCDTILSPEFGGIDISGGMWQRIAIARGLFKCHDIIVLDEPTAAVDPLEETRIYNKFAEISKDKIGIIITHRIGSARLADRIVVLKDGMIDDIGSHEYLMSKKGYYYNLYNTQAQWYV